MIAQLVGVEIVTPDAAAKGGNQRSDLHRGQHLVESCFFDIQNFSLQRQDGLGSTVTPLLCRAASRVTLDEEYLRQGRVFFLAVRKLPRQTGDVERALAACHFSGLARRLASAGRIDNLGDYRLGLLRVLEQELLQPPCHCLFNDAFNFR